MLFLLLPVGVDYRANRWPVVTLSIIGVCVAVHIWSMVLFFAGAELFESWVKTFWFIPANGSVLTMFTSMFVHGDIFHLLGNMAYLFLFGSPIEDLLGRPKFLLLYFTGGVISVLGHVALTAGHFASPIPLGGASGAISTCMGAFLLMLPRAQVEFKFFGLFFFRPFSKEFFLRSWIVMSLWFLTDVFWAVLEMTGVSDDQSTAFGAHIGGFLAGMAAVGVLKLLPSGSISDEDEEIQSTPVQEVVGISIQTTQTHPFVVLQNGSQFGPYSPEEVAHYIADGSISAEALLWREGMPEWRSVSTMFLVDAG